MPPSSASLVARDVTVSFGDTRILDRISLTIGPRSRFGIVAPNGTGKTTLMRVLAGLLPADSGTVSLTPPSATVGYLPQLPRTARRRIGAGLSGPAERGWAGGRGDGARRRCHGDRRSRGR